MKISKHPFRFLLLISVILFCSTSEAQDIYIYHGTSGTSKIIDPLTNKITRKKHKFDYDKNIEIQVINANPGLYKYEFLSEEIAIETPELPDFSPLSTVLSSELNLKTEAAASGRLFVEGASLEGDISDGQWQDVYRKKIEDLKKLIQKAETIIAESDAPQSISKAIDLSPDGGFIGAKSKLEEIKIFKTDFEKEHEIWKTKLTNGGAPYYFIPEDNPEAPLLMELYDNYYKILLAKIKELKSSFGPEVSSTVTYKTQIKEKKIKVKLKVVSKNSKHKNREVGDSIVTIELVPNYKRAIVELIPVATLAQSRNGKQFGIENGIITAAEKDEFQFGVGAMLNVNLLTWGPRKELSLGTGVGFALVDQKLDNFFVSTNINFGDWVRLGIGYGWLQTPTGLKDGLSSGDSADDINDIDDVINFSREPAFFISLVIPGLNLPILK